MECPNCNNRIDDFGFCECVTGNGDTSRRELMGFALFLLVTSMVLGFEFFITPWRLKNEAVSLVERTEADFLRSFREKVASDPAMSILGWETDIVGRWGLVTYLYEDKPGSNEKKAYLWCVDLDAKKVYRLRGLKEFVDRYLLRDEAAEAPPATAKPPDSPPGGSRTVEMRRQASGTDRAGKRPAPPSGGGKQASP